MKTHFDIFIWTTESSEYAQKVIKYVNQRNHYVSGILNQ